MREAIERAKRAAVKEFDGIDSQRDLRQTARAAIDAFLSALKSEGLVLVRREPTNNMMLQGVGTYNHWLDFESAKDPVRLVKGVYAAMLSASEQPGKGE